MSKKNKVHGFKRRIEALEKIVFRQGKIINQLLDKNEFLEDAIKTTFDAHIRFKVHQGWINQSHIEGEKNAFKLD